MGFIVFWMFFALFLKGFGKAITHTDKERRYWEDKD